MLTCMCRPSRGLARYYAVHRIPCTEGPSSVRYEKGHKDATRKRIATAAAKHLRKEGVGSVGVAGLMADAGLTHGGFYAHFGSKEELFREAVGNALDETLARLTHFAKGDPGGLE